MIDYSATVTETPSAQVVINHHPGGPHLLSIDIHQLRHQWKEKSFDTIYTGRVPNTSETGICHQPIYLIPFTGSHYLSWPFVAVLDSGSCRNDHRKFTLCFPMTSRWFLPRNPLRSACKNIVRSTPSNSITCYLLPVSTRLGGGFVVVYLLLRSVLIENSPWPRHSNKIIVIL